MHSQSQGLSRLAASLRGFEATFTTKWPIMKLKMMARNSQVWLVPLPESDLKDLPGSLVFAGHDERILGEPFDGHHHGAVENKLSKSSFLLHHGPFLDARVILFRRKIHPEKLIFRKLP